MVGWFGRALAWLKRNYTHYVGFILPLKWLYGVLVVIVVGPGILGFATAYATHWYAVKNGFRVPLEGLAYIPPVITLLNIILLFLFAVTFALTLALARYAAAGAIKGWWIVIDAMVRQSDPDPARIDSAVESLRQRSHGRILLYAVAVFAAVWAVMFAVEAIQFYRDPLRFGDVDFRGRFSNPYVWLMVREAVFAGAIALSYLLTLRPVLAWFVAAAAPVCVIVVAAVVMFDSDSYGRFLRYIGYGGGIAVRVEVKDEAPRGGAAPGAPQPPPGYSGQLMLRTEKFLILREPVGTFREIPVEQVGAIVYDPLTNPHTASPP